MQTFDIDIKSRRNKNNGLDQYSKECGKGQMVRCFGACWTSLWGGGAQRAYQRTPPLGIQRLYTTPCTESAISMKPFSSCVLTHTAFAHNSGKSV